MNEFEDFVRSALRIGIVLVVVFAAAYGFVKLSRRHSSISSSQTRVHVASAKDVGYAGLRPVDNGAAPQQ